MPSVGKNLGEEKKMRIVEILVVDEPGVLSKISGLFSRRGFNIDTIIVGKTNIENISRIVISLTVDERTIEQLDKQLYKLIDVVRLSSYGRDSSVVREHCLVKVASTEKTRSDLLNIGKLFGANILDAGAKSIIIELSSEPSKIDSFIDALSKHGIKELSRTGVNALRKD